LQAIPLPAGLLAAIAPHNFTVWAHALDPLGEPAPSWMPISLDPGATWLEVVKGMGYAGVVIASQVIATRRGATFGVGLVFATGVTAGGFTLGHALAGLDKVFGIYTPHASFAAWHIGPLLNPNHLAGYLNLAAMCGLGLLLMNKPPIPRWLTGLGVATTIGVAVSSASRGAIALLPVGILLIVLLLQFRGRRHGEMAPSGMLRGLSVVAGVVGFGLAVLGMTTTQWEELLQKDLSKLSMISWAKPLVIDHPLFGIGRGAFETVYPAYRVDTGHVLFTHPENILAQWAAEWGAPVAIASMLFFAWLTRPSRMGATRSAVAAGAWAGLAVLVLHNWVDFSLELPSVAISAMVLVGACWGDTARRGVEPEPLLKKRGALASAARAWIPVAVFVLIGSAALLLGWRLGTPTATTRREQFFELSKGAPMHRDPFRPILRTALKRHPADPYFPLAGALRAWRARDENPVPYLQRVFERAAVYGRAHLLLAEILFARGANHQALMELRFATRDDETLAGPAVALAIKHTLLADELSRMVPEGQAGTTVLDALGSWLAARAPEAGKRMDADALRRDPKRLGPRLRMAEALLREIEAGDKSESCGMPDKLAACANELGKHADALARDAHGKSFAARTKARALVAMGKLEEAGRVLDGACEHVSDRLDCLRARLDVAVKMKDEKAIEQALKAALGAGCKTPSECAGTYVWAGGFQQSRGNHGAAATLFEKATRQDPRSTSAWVALAQASSQIGAHGRAARAYERALEIDASNEEWKVRRDEEKQKAVGSLLIPQ